MSVRGIKRTMEDRVSPLSVLETPEGKRSREAIQRVVVQRIEAVQRIESAYLNHMVVKRLLVIATQFRQEQNRVRNQEKPLFVSLKDPSKRELDNALEELYEWEAQVVEAVPDIFDNYQDTSELAREVKSYIDIIESCIDQLNEMRAVDEEIYMKVKIALDKKNNLKAIVFYELDEDKKPCDIDYLCSSPGNVFPDREEFKNGRMKGAATSLLEHVIYENLRKSYKGSLSLTAVPLAVKFYEKLGFELGTFYKGASQIKMKLNLASAIQLLKSDRAGRARLTL